MASVAIKMIEAYSVTRVSSVMVLEQKLSVFQELIKDNIKSFIATQDSLAFSCQTQKIWEIFFLYVKNLRDCLSWLAKRDSQFSSDSVHSLSMVQAAGKSWVSFWFSG